MTSAVLLLLYALVVSAFCPRLLSRAVWPTRAPRAGILAWQSLTASVLSALALSGVALTVGLTHVSTDVASVADLCATTLQQLYASPAGWVGSTLGLLVVAGGIARLLFSAGWLALDRRRSKERLLRVLDLVAERDVPSGALVIDHASPYAFCLSGLAPRVVVTSALLSTLNPPQVAAVLAHEAAHLRQHHHLVMFVARALTRAFGPVLPWLHAAEHETAYLVELMADDAAARFVGRRPLREALAALRDMPIGDAALAASATRVQQRVHRLEAKSPVTRPLITNLLMVALVIGALTPLVLLAMPALPAAWYDLCLVQ